MNDYFISIEQRNKDFVALIIFILSFALLLVPGLFISWLLSLCFLLYYFDKRFMIFSFKKDFLKFMMLKIKLERELVESGFGVRVFNSDNKKKMIFRAPIVKLEKVSDKKIRVFVGASINSLVSMKKLELSPLLSGWRQVRVSTNRGNDFVIYELESLEYDRQFIFKSISDVVSKNKDFKKILIDEQTFISTFSHILISGQTGAGKSYALLYLLIIYSLKKAIISVCDPKFSDLADFSRMLKISSFSAPSLIVEEVRKVFEEMENRKRKRLSEGWKIGTTATDNGLELRILVIDEFASLQMKLDKKELAELMKYLNQIILEGRGLGIFVVIGMQQANSSILPTALREQFSAIFVLGNSGVQTFNVAFQDKARDLPDFVLEVGEGWLMKNGEVDPVLIRFPRLDFLR
ncbi:hypothetical protein [Streptococcus mitis]|uniref:hypothetical protein n=1 Tax=Streptococcus mitis TaxID=28037 RepID=UPI0021B4D578|nr:hypothetical protein [Streptococcus mitis]